MKSKTLCTVLVGGQSLFLPLGSLLQEALAPFGEVLPCAGQGRCGNCKVLAKGGLSAPNAAEKQHLTQQELRQGWRLACQARILGDCRLWPAPQAAPQIQGGQAVTGKGRPRFAHYGVAVDIGTTTLAAQLYGRKGLLASAMRKNPQGLFGADVISRVQQALAGKGNELATCIRQALDGMLEDMCRQAAILPNEIEAVVAAGNTCMLMLLAGHSPASLAGAPFEADRLFGETIPAGQLGLSCPNAEVYLPRCVSAFVGADITAALLASGMVEHNKSALLVDAGTNGEVALWHEGRLVCCSTAAGPAFEGAGLSMGMAGQEGAVEHVRLKQGELVAQVIGDSAPRGICGSGVIDALACLLASGQMDATGLLRKDPALVADHVVLTQRDIRMVQLAKGAIRAGLETLLAENNMEASALSRFYVAGGFGSYIDMENAAQVGLFPKAVPGRECVLGNAALIGATRLLLHRPLEASATKIAHMARVYDLAASPTFQRLYEEHMLFEEE